jgi:hypothetical protein
MSEEELQSPEDVTMTTSDTAPNEAEGQPMVQTSNTESASEEHQVDEDETWTNQPHSENSEGEDSEPEDSEDEEESTEPIRKKIETGVDVLTEELPFRAEKAAARLKPFLTARVLFELSDSGDKYLFDWTDKGPIVTSLPKDSVVIIDEDEKAAKSEGTRVDTTIALSERAVMAIRSGELNPQVGMLTEKIQVLGKVSPAVYIFNVIAPRS